MRITNTRNPPQYAEKEQNDLEGEGDGPSFSNSIEEVIDSDLQLIPLICHDDPVHEDNNKVAEQSLMITNLETTEESHWLVPTVIDLQSDAPRI